MCSRSAGCSTSSSPSWGHAAYGGNKDPESGVLAGRSVFWVTHRLGTPIRQVEAWWRKETKPFGSQNLARWPQGPGPQEGAREQDAAWVILPVLGPHPREGADSWGAGKRGRGRLRGREERGRAVVVDG